MSIAEVYNLNTVYGILVVSCLGVGGIIVPCAIICTIITPDDLIATITALTHSIRVLGGAIGFTAYYNVFYHKFVGLATKIVGENTIAIELLCFNYETAYAATFAAGNAQFALLREIVDTAECFNDPIVSGKVFLAQISGPTSGPDISCSQGIFHYANNSASSKTHMRTTSSFKQRKLHSQTPTGGRTTSASCLAL